MVDEPWWLSLDPRLLALLKYEIDPRLRAEIERIRELKTHPRLRAEIERLREMGQQVTTYERRMVAARARQSKPPKSRRGRPKGSGVLVASDRRLYPDMIKLIDRGESAEAAALKLACETNKVKGWGTQKSRATRLAKRFRREKTPGLARLNC
jgi:hypothetical protein